MPSAPTEKVGYGRPITANMAILESSLTHAPLSDAIHSIEGSLSIRPSSFAATGRNLYTKFSSTMNSVFSKTPKKTNQPNFNIKKTRNVGRKTYATT